MKLPKHPLRINVGFLHNTSIGTSRDIHFKFPSLLLEEELPITDLNGFARTSRTPQGILVQGEFSGSTPVECVRCLTEFTQPLKTSFSELYAFDTRSSTESNLILPEDANIDLEPLVREYFLIEIPISALCSPDCKGLCPECGENLNRAICEHVTA